MSREKYVVILLVMLVFLNCNKKSSDGNSPPPTPNFYSTDIKLNSQTADAVNYNINLSPVLKFSFSASLNKSTVNTAISFKDKAGTSVSYSTSYENNDKTVIVQPSAALNYLTKYSVTVTNSLK